MEDQQRTEVIETRPSSSEVRDVDTTPPTREVKEVDAAPLRNYTPPRSEMDRLESVAYDAFEARRMIGYRITELVYWVFGLIEGLIAIRFVLKALGANPAAGFAQFIYGITDGLVSPFVNLFADPAFRGTTLELSSLIAFVVYGLLAWLVGRLVWLVIGETRSAMTTRSTQIISRDGSGLGR